MISLLYLGLPLLTGFLVAGIFLPFQVGDRGRSLFRISLAPGLGLGLYSLLAFFWLLLFDSWKAGLLLAEICLVLGLLAREIFQSSPWTTTKITTAQSRDPGLLVFSFFLLLTVTVILFAFLVYINPHGLWDSWAIWNLRARFLYRGAGRWTEAFSPLLAHADYPPLLPLMIARSWFQGGQETILVPALIAGLFTWSAVGLLVGVFFLLGNRNPGYLAGMVLLGTPGYIFWGADQMADIPLGFYFLATVILLFLYDRRPELGHRLILLAGLMTGFAGWTKNEGLLFIITIPLARCCVPQQRWPAYVKSLLFFGAGLIPAVTAISLFKTCLAPPNDLWSGQGWGLLLNKLTDFPRLAQVGQALGAGLYHFGQWPLISLNLLLLLYALAAGTPWRRLAKDLAPAAVILSFLLLGYFFVFVLSPHDLTWHLDTALNRLLLQLWPIMVFIYFQLLVFDDQTFQGYTTN